MGELTLENRSAAPRLEECNSIKQTDRQVYRSEIQQLNSEFENLGSKINCNRANQTASSICTTPQSSTISVIDTGQSTCQFSPDVSESGSHISPGVNGVSVYNASACNSVKNTNTIATSCIHNMSAHSQTSVDTSQYELSLSKCSDSSKQVAVPFIRELDAYFTLRKPPERLRLPIVFHSILDPFANQQRGKSQIHLCVLRRVL